MRIAAFEHVRILGEVHDHLTVTELKPGFIFDGERIPLVSPQRGIFKPQTAFIGQGSGRLETLLMIISRCYRRRVDVSH
jgi:hypothetical protein